MTKLTTKQLQKLAQGVVSGYVLGEVKVLYEQPVRMTRRSVKMRAIVEIPDVGRAVTEWQVHNRTFL